MSGAGTARAALMAALLALASCDDDDAAAAHERDASALHDAGATAPCYTTRPLESYCAQPDSFCNRTLAEAEAAACARDGGTGDELLRFVNSCNGVTLGRRKGERLDDDHFAGTLDFIGHTDYSGAPSAACPLGPSTTYGAPCDRLGEGEIVDCSSDSGSAFFDP